MSFLWQRTNLKHVIGLNKSHQPKVVVWGMNFIRSVTYREISITKYDASTWVSPGRRAGPSWLGDRIGGGDLLPWHIGATFKNRVYLTRQLEYKNYISKLKKFVITKVGVWLVKQTHISDWTQSGTVHSAISNWRLPNPWDLGSCWLDYLYRIHPMTNASQMKFLKRLLTFITRRRPQSPSQATTETHPPQAASSTNMFHGIGTVNIIGGTFFMIGKTSLASSLCIIRQLSSSTVDRPWRKYSNDWNADKRYWLEKGQPDWYLGS